MTCATASCGSDATSQRRATWSADSASAAPLHLDIPAFCSGVSESGAQNRVFASDIDGHPVVRAVGIRNGQYVYRCPNRSCRNQFVVPEVLPAPAIIDWSLDPGQRIGERVDGRGVAGPTETGHDRRVDELTLLGVMDMRGLEEPYFFLLSQPTSFRRSRPSWLSSSMAWSVMIAGVAPGSMSKDEVLARLSSLRQHHRQGKRSPHKPLLVLFALGRRAATGSGAIAWSAAAGMLAELIRDYGPPSSTQPAQRAAYPFTRLRSDGIWTLDHDVPMDRVQPLTAHQVIGRLDPALENALRDPEIAGAAARQLVDAEFPPPSHRTC